MGRGRAEVRTASKKLGPGTAMANIGLLSEDIITQRQTRMIARSLRWRLQ